MSDRSWLENLKPGDVVLETWARSYRRRIVERLTKTQVVLEGGCRYRRKDGWRCGERNAWSLSKIHEATPERLAELDMEERRIKAIQAIRGADLEKWATLHEMPIEKLERLAEVVQEVTASE